MNRVPIFLPNPGDGSQTLLGTRVGRFWMEVGRSDADAVTALAPAPRDFSDPASGLGDTIASTRQMRTAPLWGARLFNALSGANQHNLVQFVRSL